VRLSKKLTVSEKDAFEAFAEKLSRIVIHEAEAVSVVGSAEVIPHAVGDIPFIEYRNNVAHPIFAPLELGVADGPELSAPKYLIGVRVYPSLCGRKIVLQKALVHSRVFRICVLVLIDYSFIISVALYIAGIGHISVIEQRSPLKHASLVCKFMGRIAMEGVYDIFILPHA
jgi:hypothetical protein